ncbi:MAG: DUF4403 family protein, partial [Pseudomonadota bacterium]
VEIPVRVPLAPVLAEAERVVPFEVRRDRHWQDHKGAEITYAARRGPLELHARGDTLFLRTMVAYWLKARKKVLGGIPVSGSCGINEPPRMAVVSLAVRFGVRPDWRLAARSTVLPPAFLNPCRMTVLSIDVTGALGQALRRQLGRVAARVLENVTAQSTGGQALAADAWERLQTPVPLGDEAWFMLNPRAVWATQPVADGQDVSLVLGLAARPALVSGAPPDLETTPLPRLGVAPPREPLMRFPVRLAVDLADADALLRAALRGQRFAWAGSEILVDETHLSADSKHLIIDAVLSGDLVGKVRLWGTPAFDAETQTLYLTDVDYELETEDTEVRQLDAGFHELMLGVIAERARWPLTDRIATARTQAEEVLNQLLPPGVSLRTSLGDITLQDIQLSETAIVVTGAIEGNVHLLLD